MTTGNSTHVLPDGTKLMISGVHYSDADRHVVTGTIAPDETIDAAHALDAALAWVSTP
jgi:hypothetical protein